MLLTIILHGLLLLFRLYSPWSRKFYFLIQWVALFLPPVDKIEYVSTSLRAEFCQEQRETYEAERYRIEDVAEITLSLFLLYLKIHSISLLFPHGKWV